jgi:hypothetical protein
VCVCVCVCACVRVCVLSACAKLDLICVCETRPHQEAIRAHLRPVIEEIFGVCGRLNKAVGLFDPLYDAHLAVAPDG